MDSYSSSAKIPITGALMQNYVQKAATLIGDVIKVENDGKRATIKTTDDQFIQIVFTQPLMTPLTNQCLIEVYGIVLSRTQFQCHKYKTFSQEMSDKFDRKTYNESIAQHIKPCDEQIIDMPPVLTSDDIRQQLDQLIASNKVLLFTTSTCRLNVMVKELFKSLNVEIVVVQLDVIARGRELRQALTARVGRPSLPQVFIAGKHIGGCDDTHRARDDGLLAKLLKGHDYDLIGSGSEELAALTRVRTASDRVLSDCPPIQTVPSAVPPTPSPDQWSTDLSPHSNSGTPHVTTATGATEPNVCATAPPIADDMDKHMWDFLASGLASGSGPKVDFIPGCMETIPDIEYDDEIVSNSTKKSKSKQNVIQPKLSNRTELTINIDWIKVINFQEAHITLKTGRIVNICELKSETRALSCKIRFDTKLTTRIPIQLIGEKYLRDRIVKYLIDHVNEVKVMQVVNDDKHELPDYCTLCYGSHSFTSCRNCRYCYGSDHQAIDCILLQNKMDYLGQTDKPDKKFVPLDKMSKSNRKCWNRKQKCGFVMEAYFRLSPLISTIVPPYDNFNDNMIYYSIDVEGAQVQVNGVNSNVAVQVVLSARFANQMKITSIFSTYIRKPKGLYDTMITVSGVNVAVLEDKTKTLPIEDVRKHLFHYVCNNTLVGHTLVKSDLAMLGITIAELNQIKCKTIDIKDLFGGLSLKDIAFANLIGKDRKPLRIQEYQKSTTSRPLSGHNCEVDCRVTLKAFHKWKFATLEEKQMMANAAKALAFIKANL